MSANSLLYKRGLKQYWAMHIMYRKQRKFGSYILEI